MGACRLSAVGCRLLGCQPGGRVANDPLARRHRGPARERPVGVPGDPREQAALVPDLPRHHHRGRHGDPDGVAHPGLQQPVRRLLPEFRRHPRPVPEVRRAVRRWPPAGGRDQPPQPHHRRRRRDPALRLGGQVRLARALAVPEHRDPLPRPARGRGDGRRRQRRLPRRQQPLGAAGPLLQRGRGAALLASRRPRRQRRQFAVRRDGPARPGDLGQRPAVHGGRGLREEGRLPRRRRQRQPDGHPDGDVRPDLAGIPADLRLRHRDRPPQARVGRPRHRPGHLDPPRAPRPALLPAEQLRSPHPGPRHPDRSSRSPAGCRRRCW